MTPFQLKRTLQSSIGGLWGGEPSGDSRDIAVVRVADFDYDGLVARAAPTARQIEPNLVVKRQLCRGDLLIEKSGGGEKQNVGRVVQWVGPQRAICSNFVNRLRPAPGMDSRWLTYLHRSLYLAGFAATCTKQTTGIQNLDLDAYLAARVRVPAIDQQRRIASFLDRELARLRRVAERTDSLDSLRGEAVSRALRDGVGLDRWPAVQIRHVARTGTGHTPSRERPEYWKPDELVVPWFTLADVWQIRDDEREVVMDTAEWVSQAGIDNSSACKHPAETVLLSRTASVGFSAVLGREMAASQDFMTWTCGPRLDPYFLLFVLRAIRPELRRLMYGSTHRTIYMPDLHALRTPLPPVAEQRVAVAKIRASLAPHWQMRRNTRLLRERLTEYRDALITEAVTGQLDVTRLSESQLDESAHAAVEAERPEVLSAW